MSTLPPRLLALLERELGATRVYVAAPDEASALAASDATLTTSLPRGLVLVVELSGREADRVALGEKLDALVETFRESLQESLVGVARPKPAEALHEELRGLATAASAIDAVVIDATSSVTWGAADAADAAPRIHREPAEVIHLDKAVRRISSKLGHGPRSATDKVVAKLRVLEAMQALPRGGALSITARDATPPFTARSFATIYVLVLVFDAPFDELRVERAQKARLGTIERLVLALPPLEPSPAGGAKAVRSRR